MWRAVAQAGDELGQAGGGQRRILANCKVYQSIQARLVVCAACRCGRCGRRGRRVEPNSRLPGRYAQLAAVVQLVKEARDAALQTGAMDGMNRAFELLDELLDAER